MKLKCKASIYMPATGLLYTEGKTYDLGAEFVRDYQGYFEPMEKTAPAPVNKMVTAEKEVVKTKAIKKGKK